MVESPIFVVGCPRSGTALLRNLLRSHSKLAIPGESRFIPLFYRAFGDPRRDREARRLAARILRLQTVRSWNLSLRAQSLAHCRSYAELTSGIYEAVARREGKPRWGDKTPSYVLAIPTLLEIFPAAKVIHIYRDGRDVAMSWTAADVGPRHLVTAAASWRLYVLAGRRDGGRFPGSYHEVRYETLLSRPAQIMQGVCDFIGEAFEEEVLRPNPLWSSGRTPLVGSRPGHHAASKTEIAGWNAAKWKWQMNADQRSLVEGVAGDLLRSLGYETEGIGRPASAVQQRLARLHSSSAVFVRSLNSRDLSLQNFLLMREARLRRRLRPSSGPARNEQPLSPEHPAQQL